MSSDQDFEAWGLGHYMRGQNAFTSIPPAGDRCINPATKKRAKTLSKVEQAAISLETPEERKERQRKHREQKTLDQRGRARVDLAPRTAGAITIHNRADAAKTSRIKQGRSI